MIKDEQKNIIFQDGDVREDRLRFVCKACGYAVDSIDVESKRVLKIKCRCQRIIIVKLIRARYKRRPTDICASVDSFPVVICDMSDTGYLVSSVSQLPLNGSGTIYFTLPNKQQTQIEEKVHVVRQDGMYFGLRADVVPYSEMQKAKGFWLMFD